MRNDTVKYIESVCAEFVKAVGMVRSDWKDVAATMDPVEFVKHLAAMRSINESIKTSREALQDMEDHLSKRDVPEIFKAKDIKTINVEGIGRCTVAYRWSCSMLDKPTCLDWLRGHELGGIIQETVAPQTLAATARSRLEDTGFDMPEDLFKTSLSPYTSITRLK